MHFVGSVALDTPEEVFAAIGKHCGPYLKRIPDGEPGGRRLWISWHLGLVHAKDGVEGTKKRIETAKKHVPAFGIASECGISRGRDPNLALEFIKTYAGAAAAAG